jgi:hypothetical protein
LRSRDGVWQGYSNYMYSVYATDQVEMILE